MDKVIGTIGKNALEQIQIAVKEYQGHTYVDIRLFFLGDDEQWHPTKKGITVSPALWPEFTAAVAQVDAQLPGEDAPHPGGGRRGEPPRDECQEVTRCHAGNPGEAWS